MPKFLILYNSDQTARDTMANATPEQMKASMDEWAAWKAEVDKIAKFEFGMPLQSAGRINADGETTSDTHVGGYSIIEGDSKDAIVAALKSHPQLKRPGASIDLLEMVPMPGM